MSLLSAPLGLLCWVLPQTQGWARLWSGTFFGVVFAQFVQVLALKLGGSLLSELAPMSPDAALLGVFLGVAVLALTPKIPSLMPNHTGDGLDSIRYYVYHQGARALKGGSESVGARRLMEHIPLAGSWESRPPEGGAHANWSCLSFRQKATAAPSHP